VPAGSDHRYLLPEIGAGTPLVFLDRPPRGIDADTVLFDNVGGARQAIEHLLRQGHTRIAFVGDRQPAPFGLSSSELRLRGHRAALERAGLEARPEYARLGGHDRDEARALAAPLFALEERPTAVFAASDTQAVGVIEAAAAAGLRVPEELAVIGFDDIELAAVVGLTTVRQPLRASGRRGAELLLAAIEGAPPPPGELEPLTVVERRTT
jgi:DNA-binding LacI/PurR family transcriptional regulator